MPVAKDATVDSPRGSAGGASSSSGNSSYNKYEDLNSNHSIEMQAIKAQFDAAKREISSLQRRNFDLEQLVQEKEFLLGDVIGKFKKER